MEALEELALEYYNRFIGLELADVAVNGCITKAPCGGRKGGQKSGGSRQDRHQTLDDGGR
jgi:hypothetical protein